MFPTTFFLNIPAWQDIAGGVGRTAGFFLSGAFSLFSVFSLPPFFGMVNIHFRTSLMLLFPVYFYISSIDLKADIPYLLHHIQQDGYVVIPG
ncbi:hypothetical protein SAMN05216436_1274 [bacterium A37T11]|nr:hypothetical protein SAMN05216436_1274 [bacterium A37T11]